NNSTIKTFTNKENGLIIGNGNGIQFNNSTIENFTNCGIVVSNNKYGLEINGKSTIENFSNQGTITSNGDNTESIYSPVGLQLYDANINTLINKGLIDNGIRIIQSTINNLNNQGTINNKSQGRKNAAILLANLNGQATVIKTLTNSGTIKADNASGILIEAGNTIENLTNSGTIEASLYGIGFYTVDKYGEEIDLGQINLESNSVIKAGQDGIHIDGGDRGIKAKGIDVQKGAKVEGGNAGIFIGDGKQLDTLIKISGEVKGGVAGIINEGVIGSSSDGQESGIKVEGGGSIASANGGSGIVNQGNGSIQGDIVVSGGGAIEGGITNTGKGEISGSITVEEGS
ncbi:hypothetical protein ACRCD5_07825, partial [Campylobacter taeniopygiae]